MDTHLPIEVDSPALTPPKPSPFCADSSSQAGYRKRKPYPCTFALCDKSYVKLQSLQKHQRRHPRCFECRYPPCSSVFLALEDRTDHELQKHGRSRQLVCYLCTPTARASAYSTESKVNFRAHVRRMHEDAAVQDVMTRVVHGLGPPGPAEVHKCADHTCYLCPFTAAKKISIYRHILLAHPDHMTCMKVAMARVKARAAESKSEEVYITTFDNGV